MTSTSVPMSMEQFAATWKQFPVVMSNAFQDASKDTLIDFWKVFKRQIPLRSKMGGGTDARPPLKSGKAWPITTVGNSLDTLVTSMGTESEAAQLFEFGGTVRPKAGQSIAIPIAAARTRSGGVKPFYSKPEKRRALGDEFILLKRNGVRYLHKLVPKKKRGRGRPRKDAGSVPLIPSKSPFFLLLDSVEVRAQLGFYETWDRYWPEATIRWEENVHAAILLLLGQPVPPRARRWLERRGGSLAVVNNAAA